MEFWYVFLIMGNAGYMSSTVLLDDTRWIDGPFALLERVPGLAITSSRHKPVRSQRLQNPLIQQYTLNPIRVPIINEGILNPKPLNPLNRKP